MMLVGVHLNRTRLNSRVCLLFFFTFIPRFISRARHRRRQSKHTWNVGKYIVLAGLDRLAEEVYLNVCLVKELSVFVRLVSFSLGICFEKWVHSIQFLMECVILSLSFSSPSLCIYWARWEKFMFVIGNIHPTHSNKKAKESQVEKIELVCDSGKNTNDLKQQSVPKINDTTTDERYSCMRSIIFPILLVTMSQKLNDSRRFNFCISARAPLTRPRWR